LVLVLVEWEDSNLQIPQIVELLVEILTSKEAQQTCYALAVEVLVLVETCLHTEMVVLAEARVRILAVLAVMAEKEKLLIFLLAAEAVVLVATQGLVVLGALVQQVMARMDRQERQVLAVAVAVAVAAL
jgi:hypothetical protein